MWHNLAQCFAHFTHAFIAVFHAEGHGLLHDAHQLLARRLFKGAQRADGKPVRYAILAIARNGAGEHEVQHTAQRVHLAGGRYLAGQLLGGHQCGGRAGPVRLADAVIHQYRLVITGQQNVGCLDVAMEERHRPFVQMMNRHQYLHNPFHGGGFSQWALVCHAVRHAHPAHILRDQVAHVAQGKMVEHTGQIGVHHLAQRCGNRVKFRAIHRIEFLHHAHLIVDGVVRSVDRAGRMRRQQRVYAVAMMNVEAGLQGHAEILR